MDAELNRVVEHATSHVERLFSTLTGRVPPSNGGAYAPIPPERDPVKHVEESAVRLVEELTRLAGLTETPTVTPPLCLSESAQEYRALIDLPGVARERIEVSVVGSHVQVRAERRPQPETGFRPWIVEVPAVRFVREIVLPVPVAAERASVRLADGVLELTLPKTENSAVKATRLPVK